MEILGYAGCFLCCLRSGTKIEVLLMYLASFLSNLDRKTSSDLRGWLNVSYTQAAGLTYTTTNTLTLSHFCRKPIVSDPHTTLLQKHCIVITHPPLVFCQNTLYVLGPFGSNPSGDSRCEDISARPWIWERKPLQLPDGLQEGFDTL